ncbi:hypothetical protein RMATCC62417_05953 [Rhizopus microsporus]|nr:hypothetical protein RMATCC62417_05953 [Rhizopus microsporus]
MISLLRFTTRTVSNHSNTRFYSTDATGSAPKVGAFRGGIIGFLLGVTAAGSAGYYYLLDEYNSASASLLMSVNELQASTDKVKDYARRIETVDRDIAKLKAMAATKQELTDMKVDLRKLYDTLNMEHLELKTHVWGLEKDLSTTLNGQQQPKHES